jgi:hypothetical protein
MDLLLAKGRPARPGNPRAGPPFLDREVTMYFRHTPECLAAHQQTAQERDAYIKAWPHYCRHCQGWGFFAYTYDPSPAGIALGPGWLQDYDPCPKCIERDLCPRCGHRLTPRRVRVKQAICTTLERLSLWRVGHSRLTWKQHRPFTWLGRFLPDYSLPHANCPACGRHDNDEGMPQEPEYVC